MPDDDLVRVLQRNLHGIAIADNDEQVMAEVVPRIGESHCHNPRRTTMLMPLPAPGVRSSPDR